MNGSCAKDREAECQPLEKTSSVQELKYFTRRWVLAYLMCVVRVCQTALRQCIGMAIVCMTNKETDVVTPLTSLNDTGVGNVTEVYDDTNKQTRSLGSEFRWSSSFEGHVLVAYYYGFLLTIMIAGYVDRSLGSVRTIAVGMAGGGVVNLLTPLLTRQHPYLLVTLRVLAGCANGLIDPAMHTLWSNWAPVSERGQLTAVEYAGNGFGGIMTFLVSALLCKIPVDRGWPFVFYFYGVVSLLFTLLWLLLARNSPETHPAITKTELSFIITGRSKLSDTKTKTPWLKIMSSGAVWAIIVAHASFSWVYSWILAYLPMYMKDVLHYTVAQNGVLSSLPFLGKLVMGILAGYLADMLLRRRFSIALVRKSFQMAGSIGCALPLLVISFLSHKERVLAVALLITSVSLQNLTGVAYRINSLDIAPRYAGFLMSLTSTIACALTLTAPYVTSALLVNKTREEWQTVLYIVTAVSVLGGVVFLACAKGDVQAWAVDNEITIHVEAGSTTDTIFPSDKNVVENGSSMSLSEPLCEQTDRVDCPGKSDTLV
ncbi:sialin-like [Littorina saxatilis]|uniref:sialin-like n=1 Tax=Littorina saxatilis TaxID=31220 RepID=UPI0038B5A63F